MTANRPAETVLPQIQLSLKGWLEGQYRAPNRRALNSRRVQEKAEKMQPRRVEKRDAAFRVSRINQMNTTFVKLHSHGEDRLDAESRCRDKGEQGGK